MAYPPANGARSRWRASAVLLALSLAACSAPAPASPGSDDGGSSPTVALPSAASSLPPSVAPVEVTVGYASQSANTLELAVAQSKGYFAAHGLTVNLVLISSGTTVVQSMLGGDSPIAQLAGNSVVAAVAEGAKIRWVADVLPTFDMKLIGNKGITSAEALRGKRLGISKTGSSTDFAATVALDRLGLTANDVTIVQVGSTPQIFPAILAGSVDAGVFSPPPSLAAVAQGYPVIYDLQANKVPYPSSGIAVSDAYAQAHPEVVRAFLAAVHDALEFMRQNPEEAAQIMVSSYEGQDATIAKQSLTEMMPAIPTSIAPLTGTLQPVIDLLGKDNPKIGALRPDDVLDASYAP